MDNLQCVIPNETANFTMFWLLEPNLSINGQPLLHGLKEAQENAWQQ